MTSSPTPPVLVLGDVPLTLADVVSVARHGRVVELHVSVEETLRPAQA
jgi:hypothetical protein